MPFTRKPHTSMRPDHTNEWATCLQAAEGGSYYPIYADSLSHARKIV